MVDERKNNDNTILKLFNWFKVFDYKNTSSCSYSKNLDSDVFRCDAFLPKINKLVTGFGDSYYEACLDVAKQSLPLIDKYLDDNPDIEIENIYTEDSYKVFTDFEGMPMVRPNNEAFRKIFLGVTTRELLVQSFVKEYSKTIEDQFGLYFQMVDRSVYPEDMDDEQLSRALMDDIFERFHDNAGMIKVRTEDRLCIVTAKILNKTEFIKKKGKLL